MPHPFCQTCSPGVLGSQQHWTLSRWGQLRVYQLHRQSALSGAHTAKGQQCAIAFVSSVPCGACTEASEGENIGSHCHKHLGRTMTKVCISEQSSCADVLHCRQATLAQWTRLTSLGVRSQWSPELPQRWTEAWYTDGLPHAQGGIPAHHLVRCQGFSTT